MTRLPRSSPESGREPWRRLLGYLHFELRGLLRVALRAFLWTTLPLGLLLFAVVVHGALTAPANEAPRGAMDAVLLLTIGLGVALFYASFPGALAAVGAAVWRFFGAWAVFPLLLLPLVLWGVWGLLDEPVTRAGMAADAAFLEELRKTDGGFGPALHGGGAALLLLLPFILLQGLGVCLTPHVLPPLLAFLGLLALAVVLTLGLTLVLSLPPLLFALASRLRERYARFVAGDP